MGKDIEPVRLSVFVLRSIKDDAVRCKLAAMVIAACPITLGAAPARAAMKKQPRAFDYEAKVYTKQGQVTGCGLGFRIAWVSAEMDTLGIPGSVAYFFLAEKKEGFATIQATGVCNFAKWTMKYAWVQTQGYGRTSDFRRRPARDHQAFPAFKYSDPKSLLIPLDMASRGFVLGIAFDTHPFEDAVIGRNWEASAASRSRLSSALLPSIATAVPCAASARSGAGALPFAPAFTWPL